MLDVGDGDDRRLRLPVEVAAPRQQRVVDDVDDDPVLDLVLRAGDELGGDPASLRRSPVRGAVPASGCDRTVPPVDLDEQLGRGTDQPVDRVPVARPKCRQPRSTAWTSIGWSAVTMIGRAMTALSDARGAPRRGPSRPRRGSARSASPARSCTLDADGIGGCGARQRLGRRADPVDEAAGRRRVLRTTTSGTTSSPVARPERHEPMARGRGLAPGRVVVVDRGEQTGGRRRPAPGRDAASGDADAVAHEQVAVAAGDVVQVERGDVASSATRVTARISGCP